MPPPCGWWGLYSWKERRLPIRIVFNLAQRRTRYRIELVINSRMSLRDSREERNDRIMADLGRCLTGSDLSWSLDSDAKEWKNDFSSTKCNHLLTIHVPWYIFKDKCLKKYQIICLTTLSSSCSSCLAFCSKDWARRIGGSLCPFKISYRVE